MIVPATLKPGTEGWSRFFHPLPTHEEITTRVHRYSESKHSEDASFVFDMFERFPENKTREIVTMKVAALLDYMGNPPWVHERFIIAHILSEKDFDRNLQRGVKSIVNKIADSSHAKHKRYDSFARYYCAFHNPLYYLPGFWITPSLWEYEKLDHFLQGENFYWGNRYTQYVKQFNKFVDFYGLHDYPTWDLHIFLSELHREEIREREHKFPCKETMGISQNSHILSIINAANHKTDI